MWIGLDSKRSDKAEDEVSVVVLDLKELGLV